MTNVTQQKNSIYAETVKSVARELSAFTVLWAGVG